MQTGSPPSSATRPVYVGSLRFTFPDSPAGRAAAEKARVASLKATFPVSPVSQASSVRKPQPSQLAIEAPKTAARTAASNPGVRTVAESPLGGQDAVAVLSNSSDPHPPTAKPIHTLLYRFTDSDSPLPAPWECPRCTFAHMGVEAEFQACGMCGTAKPKGPPPEAPRPTPLAPSPVALSLEDSPPPLPSPAHFQESNESQPSVSPTLLHANFDTDSPPGHLLGDLALTQQEATFTFTTATESEDLHAQEPNGHPLRLVVQLARHYMGCTWQRHAKPLMEKHEFRNRQARKQHLLTQALSFAIKLPWWFFVRDCLFWWYVDDEYS